MPISFVTLNDEISLTWDGVSVRLPSSSVVIAHMGCKLLGSIADDMKKLSRRNDMPLSPHEQETLRSFTELADKLDASHGRDWRRNEGAPGRVAEVLEKAVRGVGLKGAVLYDTMRKGSDYWRPGNLLLKVADQLTARHIEISFARRDEICPPAPLLDTFRQDNPQMSFAQYASSYAEELRSSGAIERAAAEAVLDLARGWLPVFYCIDPYIPGYGDSTEFMKKPYVERRWMEPLREYGCHRVVLTDELLAFFVQRGIAPTLVEIDVSFGNARHLNLSDSF